MFEEILSKIGRSFRNHDIPYMIIGGQAVLLYGEPRLTRDIDITLGINTDRLNEIIDIIRELSLKPLPKDVNEFVQKTMVLPSLDETTGIRVDFIFSFTPYETEAIERSKRIIILEEEVNFASPEDVIIHKVFAGRPRDMEDIRGIILKNPRMDIGYIQEWLIKFDESMDQKTFLKGFQEVLKETDLAY